MKKRVGKIKRFIAMLMVGITLSSSVFYSYSIPAQATTVVPAAQTVIEALMTLFGYSLGFGKSSDGMSAVLTPEVFSSAIDSSFNGGGIELGSYGTVDFSDETAVFEFLKKAYQLTTATAAGEAYDKLLSSYDYVSYKTSGVSSTKTMNNYLGDIVSKYEVEGTSALKEDLLQAFTIVNNGNDLSFTPLAWRLASAIMSGFIAVGTLPLLEDGTEDEAVIAVPADSEYVEYNLNALTFDELEVFNFSPSYSAGVISSELDEYYNCASMPHYFFQHINSSGTVECKILATELDLACCFVKQDDQFYRFYYGPSSRGRIYYQLNYFGAYASMSYYDLSGYRYELIPSDTVFYTNLPVLSSLVDLSSFCSGDVIEPLESFTTKVDAFYRDVSTSTVPEYVVNFMTKTPTASDVAGLAEALTGLSTAIAGTAEFAPAVESVVHDATIALPSVDVVPDATAAPVVVPGEIAGELTDSEIGSLVDTTSTYGGILGKLLNAVLTIPQKIFNLFVDVFNLFLSSIRDGPAAIWNLFATPFATITHALDSLIDIFPADFVNLMELITVLPVTLYEYFKDGLTDIRDGVGSLVDIFPASLADVLAGIIDLPATIWKYFEAAIADVSTDVKAIADAVTVPWNEPEDDSGSHSFDLLSLLNGLWLLIMILIMLLSIFLHLMIFIINIFKIPATTGYLNENMVMGLNYIKTLEITGIGLSVYDFMMGLVYILMVFGVVKVLRANIHHIKIPKSMRGGLFK